MRGEMLWFDGEVKQHGFIATEEGERLRVDRDGFKAGECPEGKCKGMDVEFEVVGTGEDRRAVDVTFTTAVAARRARRRASAMR
jgi:hypothetical protein